MKQLNAYKFTSYLPCIITIIVIVITAEVITALVRSSRRKWQAAKRKKAEKDEIVRLNSNIKRVTATLNGFIRGVMDQAVFYGDIVTPERLSDLIDEVQGKLDITGDYDEIMAILSAARDKAEQIRSDMERHERQLEEDLREEAEERAEKKKRYPYLDTKYFKSCTDIPSVKRLFRQLAKVYHPDSGGDAETYMALQSEYQAIVRKGA